MDRASEHATLSAHALPLGRPDAIAQATQVTYRQTNPSDTQARRASTVAPNHARPHNRNEQLTSTISGRTPSNIPSVQTDHANAVHAPCSTSRDHTQNAHDTTSAWWEQRSVQVRTPHAAHPPRRRRRPHPILQSSDRCAPPPAYASHAPSGLSRRPRDITVQASQSSDRREPPHRCSRSPGSKGLSEAVVTLRALRVRSTRPFASVHMVRSAKFGWFWIHVQHSSATRHRPPPNTKGGKAAAGL